MGFDGMKIILVVAAIALAATTVAASAQDPQPEPPSERKICRTAKMTGSLTRRTRICLTEGQWRELNDRTRRGVGDMQNSASGSPACISTHDAACGTAPGPGGQ